MNKLIDKLNVVMADITKLKVDAIVNAASPHLMGGLGVDGAIHKAAGEELCKACKKLNGCNVGEAKYTFAFNLPSKYIIHTVGPKYDKNKLQEQKELLSNCYVNCLKIAKELNLKTIAFPCISNGIYGFPLRYSVQVVVDAVLKELEENKNLKQVCFVCYKINEYEKYIDYILELKNKA